MGFLQEFQDCRISSFTAFDFHTCGVIIPNFRPLQLDKRHRKCTKYCDSQGQEG